MKSTSLVCREWKIVIETELIELAFHNYVILDVSTLMKTRLITAHISSTLLVNGNHPTRDSAVCSLRGHYFVFALWDTSASTF